MSSIGSFAPGATSARSATASLVGMRRELDDLQRQLATGKRSDDYAGLGLERGTSLNFRARIAALGGFNQAIGDAETRLKVMTQSLEQLDGIERKTKSALLAKEFTLLTDKRTQAQYSAEQDLRLAIDLLNREVNGRHFFGGRSVNEAPVADFDTMMDGVAGGPDGLRDLISERARAELGRGGYGRLTPSATATSVSFAEPDPAVPFGFTIVGAEKTGSAAITAGVAAGPPPTATFALGTAPAEGDTLTLTVLDKGGAQHRITLTASAKAPASPDGRTFLIGADAAGTLAGANGLQAAIEKAVQNKAKEVLEPRAAFAAAEDFFVGSPTVQPQRIERPAAPLDFEDATGFETPTVRDTVRWYRGDGDPTSPARGTAPVRIDASQTVATGAQANEPPLGNLLKQLAVFANARFEDTPSDRARYEAYANKVRDNLTSAMDDPKISDIATELGYAASAMGEAKERHKVTENLLQESVDEVENAPPEEVVSKLLTLQTRMQASYQTTSIVSKLSLVNFL